MKMSQLWEDPEVFWKDLDAEKKFIVFEDWTEGQCTVAR